MIRVFLFATVFLILSSARITIPIKQHHLPATVANELNEQTAQAFLAADDSTSDYYKVFLAMKNNRNIYYSGQIFVGKDKTPFQVLLDSGSNLLWLPTTKCLDCPAKTKYVCEKSETCIETSKFNQLQYGLGYVSGNMGYEFIGMSKDFQVNASLLWVNTGRDLSNYKDMDGFMGFGNMQSTNDFVDLAYQNNFIQDKVFTFYLDHNADINSASSGSYLALGYLPEDRVDKVTWVSVTNPSRWSTRIYSMKVGDVFTETGSSSLSNEVLFDTGCSFNYMNTAFVAELTKQLASLESADFLGIKFYRCDAEYIEKYPNLTVGLKGIDLTLNAYNYLYFTAPLQRWGKNYCQLAIKESTFGLQILGDSFLKNNFVAFSKRNQSMGIYQEYRPVVLPPAPNNFYMVIIVLVVALILAVIIFRKNDKKVQKLNAFLKNEGGAPETEVAI